MIKASIQVLNDITSPYHFYQIREVIESTGSFWTRCYVDGGLSSKVMEIARIIASTYDSSAYEVEVKDMRDVPGKLLQH